MVLPRTTLSSSLGFTLSLVRAAATISRRFDGRLGSWHGISFADFGILLQLSLAPGARLRRVDLAEQLGLTASAVTRALLPLEKIGLVSRKPDPNDARVGYATLTATGRRVLTEALETAAMISGEIVPDGDKGIGECSRLLDRAAGKEPERPERKRKGRG